MLISRQWYDGRPLRSRAESLSCPNVIIVHRARSRHNRWRNKAEVFYRYPYQAYCDPIVLDLHSLVRQS